MKNLLVHPPEDLDKYELSQVALAWQLAYRLERLSVDSHWAHLASGLRGSLLKRIELFEEGKGSLDTLPRLPENGAILAGFGDWGKDKRGTEKEGRWGSTSLAGRLQAP